MTTPDITPAQIVSAIGAIVGLLVSNLLIDDNTAKLITNIAAIVVPICFIFADAIIRHARAYNAAQIAQTKLTRPATTAGTTLKR